MRHLRLTTVLGFEPHTSLDEAVAATLTGMRCIGTHHGGHPGGLKFMSPSAKDL